MEISEEKQKILDEIKIREKERSIINRELTELWEKYYRLNDKRE